MQDIGQNRISLLKKNYIINDLQSFEFYFDIIDTCFQQIFSILGVGDIIFAFPLGRQN